MTRPKQEEQNLTRREALKTLAAAVGAIAMTSLPNQWKPPVIEVGVLPAHAQSSSFPISNLSSLFTGVNDCGASGSTSATTFSYYDPTGNVTAGSIINDFYEYLPGGFSDTVTFSVPSAEVTQIGDGFSGILTFTSCALFAGDTSIRDTITLTNAAGVTSQSLTVTTQAPIGANSTEVGPGRRSK